MEDPFIKMQRRAWGIIIEELRGWIRNLLRGMLDPGQIINFIQSMGFDISQLPGMLQQQPEFDPYQVLGLDKSASDEEVKHRYRELMHILHQDKSGTPGTNFLFRMVLAAYERIRKQRRWEA